MWSTKGINLIIGPEEIFKHDKELKELEAADAVLVNKQTAKELTWAKQRLQQAQAP